MPTIPTDSSEQAGVTSAAQVNCHHQGCSLQSGRPGMEAINTAGGSEASPEQGDQSRPGDDGQVQQSSGKFVAMGQAQSQARESRSGSGLVEVNRVRHSPVIARQVYNDNNKH